MCVEIAQVGSVYCYRCERSGSNLESVKSYTVSPTALHRCDVSSELFCPGFKPRR